MNKEAERLFSLQLYGYLCDKLGDEDLVKIRRTYFSALDCTSESCFDANISSGSKAEGLDIKGSDLDLMNLYKNVHISECCDKSLPNTFVMETDESKPGFTQLKLSSFINNDLIYQWCIHVGSDQYLSNDLAKNWFKTAHKNLILIHGPCVTDIDNTIDHAICFRCKTWVQQAQLWVTRPRLWPSSQLVNKIASYGVLVVPVGSKGSQFEDTEWRLSFSVAEKLLICSFTQTQLFCYALLKILFKEVIVGDSRREESDRLLCSYHLKTIVLWVSEDLPNTEWHPMNLFSCFNKCLQRLMYFIEYRFLPHYFVQDYNLFDDKGNTLEWCHLKHTLSIIYGRSISEYFGQSKTMRSFLRNGKYSNITKNISASSPVIGNKIKALRSIQSLNLLTHIPQLLITEPLLSMLVQYKTKRIFSIVSLVCFQTCKFICQVFQFSAKSRMINLSVGMKGLRLTVARRMSLAVSGSCNKEQYKQQKQLMPYILLSTKNDSVTGWLYLASYFYNLRNYEDALLVIDNVLAKCTPDKIFFRNASHEHIDSVELEAYKYHLISIADIYRRHGMETLYFYDEAILLPAELKTELLFQKEIEKPPVVYAHFLRFLCCHHMFDESGCEVALSDLQFVIAECYYIGNPTMRGGSYTCLGIAQQLSRQRDDAVSSFKKALDFDPNLKDYVNFMTGSL